MTKRGTAFAVVALVLVAVIGTTVVMAQSGDERPPNVEVVDLEQIKEDVVRELFDSTGKMINPDQRLADVAKDHKGGFGGFYFHETDKSIAYVYMLDVTNTIAAEAAFRAAYHGSREITQIIPVQGDYSFDRLVEWFYILDRALIESGIIPMTGSVRELENRIYIGLEDEGLIDDALQVMKKLGIPEGAVVFLEEGYRVLLADEDSVRAKWRPLVGGIQHEEGWYSGTCTIGFVTERDGVEGLVIASHCTNSDGDIGGLDDADVHQPNDPLFGSNIVAEETIDPPLRKINHSQCPSGWKCRYSDAAFAELDSDESLDLGEIAKPEDIGETDVDPAGTTFEITAEAGYSVGDEVYYIGRTEGWQTAEVIETCQYAPMAPQVRIICIGRARMTGDSPDPSKGDSGGPVIKLDVGSDVELLGTIFARHPVYTDEFDFSPIGNIYLDLGQASTWDSCVSGC